MYERRKGRAWMLDYKGGREGSQGRGKGITKEGVREGRTNAKVRQR